MSHSKPAQGASALSGTDLTSNARGPLRGQASPDSFLILLQWKFACRALFGGWQPLVYSQVLPLCLTAKGGCPRPASLHGEAHS